VAGNGQHQVELHFPESGLIGFKEIQAEVIE
jgi:hypothetical protein